jgi:hypothetical protein
MKEKLNIVSDELEELKTIEECLDRIEKNLPILNSDAYLQIRPQSQNIDMLLSASEL